MKKLFSIVLMVLVAACMTGCSLHGGHGHGPNTGAMMTLRTSVPGSVFGVGQLESLRGALRGLTAEEKKNLVVEFGGQKLTLDYEDTVNNIFYFAAKVAKAIVQEMAAKGDDEKVEIIVKDAAGNAIAQINVNLPEDFAEDTEATANKETAAAVKITADATGTINGAGTITVAQLAEVIGEKLEKIITKLAATESKKQTIEVLDDKGEIVDTITESEQAEISDVTEVVPQNNIVNVNFTFKRVTGLTFENTNSDGSHSGVKTYTLGTEIKENDTVYSGESGTGIAVIPSVTMFDRDESKALNTASATLKISAKNKEGVLIEINGYGGNGNDDYIHSHGIDVTTRDNMWFITMDGENVPTGELTFAFTNVSVPSKDGKTVYSWSSPKTFKVNVQPAVH